MPNVTEASAGNVLRLPGHRLAPPPGKVSPIADGFVDFARVRQQAEARRVAPPAPEEARLARVETAPSGVEPLSTHSVLQLRETATPAAQIADAYGLSPAAVQRMMMRSATAGERSS